MTAVAPIKASAMNEISRHENRNTGIYHPKKPKRVSIWIDAGYCFVFGNNHKFTHQKSSNTIVLHIEHFTHIIVGENHYPARN